jgi:hypothetical protein
MLLTKTVEITLNSQLINHFDKLGYEIPRRVDKYKRLSVKRGEKLIVKVEDLPKTSTTKIEVLCDYCLEEGNETIISKEYGNYLTERKKFSKDCCKKCNQKKRNERAMNLQINKPNKKLEGYYAIKENLIHDFKEYIEKFQDINNMDSNKEISNLYHWIYKHETTPILLAQELGYDLKLISKRKPDNFYNNYDEFLEKIKSIIKVKGYFPTKPELKDYNIFTKDLLKFGGIYTIKKDLGYKELYIDNNGFYNNSYYEVIVANFLIAQQLGDKYKREQNPFPKDEGKYRSDFAFEMSDGKKIHIEVWGYPKNSNHSVIANEYNTVRNKKEYLYEKYNIELISVECAIFNSEYKVISKKLYDIFKDYLELPYKKVSQDSLIPVNSLTDDELFDILKNYIKDGILPDTLFLRNNGMGKYYDEILRRFGNYNEFAKLYGCKVRYKSNSYWTLDIVYELFYYMMKKYNKILNRKELEESKDYTFHGLMPILQSKFNGFLYEKTKYLKHYVYSNNIIPNVELEWIYNVCRQNSMAETKFITEEIRSMALDILEYLKNTNQLQDRYLDYNRTRYVEDETLNIMYDIFMYMIKKYGHILSEKECKNKKDLDCKLAEVNIYKRMLRKQWNANDIKNNFYNYCKENNIILPTA